jgi:integrase
MGVFLKNGNWFIDYRANGRRIREKVGPTKNLAEMVLKKRRVEIAEGKFLDIKRKQKVKFEELTQMYLDIHARPNKKSYHSDEDLIKTLGRFFGGKYLHEITPMAVEQFKAERAKEVSPATVNRALACLKCMFNKAIGWGKTEVNPAKKVKLFKENNVRVRYLEKEEIKKLIDNAAAHLKPVLIVALNTGMRKGEILNLKWHDLDFKNNIIYIRQSKSGEKREVPMNPLVRRTLIAVRKHPDSPYVFCNEKGESFANVRKSFFTAVKKSGIIKFRFHDLRHTFASHLVMSGVDLNTVRELLGHKSLEMTLRYSHLSPDHKQRAVANLSRQMDTFWTPERTKENEEVFDFSQLFENKEVVNIQGPAENLR